MRKSKLLTAALAATLVLPLAAQAERYRLSLSTWGSPKHPQVTQFVPKFVELVEEKSDGRIRMRVFEGGEMVKQQFVATAVPQGTVDISLTTLDNWSGRIPEVTALASPLWTWSMERARDELVPGKPVFDYFDSKLKDTGAMMIAMFDIGPPVLSANFDISKPEDMKGKTVRVYSKGAGQMMQALGAAPTTIGVGEVYSALQRGTVDGALGGLGGAVGLKHYEVTGRMFAPMGALGTLVHAYVMNKQNFEALPPDLQKVVMDAAAEARNQAQQHMIDSYDELLGVVREHGKQVVKLEEGSEQWNAWRAAQAPLIKQARAAYPPKLVEMIESESGDSASKPANKQ
jgi:TRAP-type C4-dicarboxylate transport system substrate-binding protein